MSSYVTNTCCQKLPKISFIAENLAHASERYGKSMKIVVPKLKIKYDWYRGIRDNTNALVPRHYGSRMTIAETQISSRPQSRKLDLNFRKMGVNFQTTTNESSSQGTQVTHLNRRSPISPTAPSQGPFLPIVDDRDTTDSSHVALASVGGKPFHLFSTAIWVRPASSPFCSIS